MLKLKPDLVTGTITLISIRQPCACKQSTDDLPWGLRLGLSQVQGVKAASTPSIAKGLQSPSALTAREDPSWLSNALQGRYFPPEDGCGWEQRQAAARHFGKASQAMNVETLGRLVDSG